LVLPGLYEAHSQHEITYLVLIDKPVRSGRVEYLGFGTVEDECVWHRDPKSLLEIAYLCFTLRQEVVNEFQKSPLILLVPTEVRLASLPPESAVN
jgi:hypothetical protein